MEMKHLGLFILFYVTSGLFLPAYGDVYVNISGSSFRGFIAEEVFLLSALQELVLHGNKLIGPIPASIGSLKYLKVLDLSNNELTGPIPSEIGNLVSIITINLESNGLTGQLPFKIGNLQDLRLDRNRLHGTIPGAYANASGENKHGFCRLSSLEYADFSYNFLTGRIPKCLEYLPRINFRGNCLSYKDIKRRTDEQCALVPPANALNTRDSKPAWLLAVEVVTGVTVGSLFLIAVFTFVLRCRSKPSILNIWKKSRRYKDHMAVYVDSNMLKGVTKYSRQELEVACEDFSNIIGRAANEPNEHEQDLVRVRLLRNICVREPFTNTYRTRFYVRVCLLRKGICSCSFVFVC
ncbi:putative non-specific serine/threonine protein kinase [Helianthus annuus]|nr:putative non-specific serine/threonine protein kinase [Helianthus annuus]